MLLPDIGCVGKKIYKYIYNQHLTIQTVELLQASRAYA